MHQICLAANIQRLTMISRCVKTWMFLHLAVTFSVTFTTTILAHLWPFPQLNSMTHLNAVASMPFVASVFVSQLPSFTDEPAGVHAGSYNHIACWARGKLVQRFPHLSPAAPLAHCCTSGLLLFYLWIIGFHWQRNSSTPPGNGAWLHMRLCSSNEIDFGIICLCV